MCCLFLVLMFLGPRFGFLVVWLTNQGQFLINQAFDTWIIPLLGVAFLPWTTLMIVFVSGANGLVGWDWLWVGLALAADIASYSASAYKRKSVPGYPATAP
jgi:hypothetical protein